MVVRTSGVFQQGSKPELIIISKSASWIGGGLSWNKAGCCKLCSRGLCRLERSPSCPPSRRGIAHGSGQPHPSICEPKQASFFYQRLSPGILLSLQKVDQEPTCLPQNRQHRQSLSSEQSSSAVQCSCQPAHPREASAGTAELRFSVVKDSTDRSVWSAV